MHINDAIYSGSITISANLLIDDSYTPGAYNPVACFNCPPLPKSADNFIAIKQGVYTGSNLGSYTFTGTYSYPFRLTKSYQIAINGDP